MIMDTTIKIMVACAFINAIAVLIGVSITCYQTYKIRQIENEKEACIL